MQYLILKHSRTFIVLATLAWTLNYTWQYVSNCFMGCITRAKDHLQNVYRSCLFKIFPLQKILTHSYSRVVLRVLEKAASEKKRFSVYVTESQPDSAGWGIPAEKLCPCLFFAAGTHIHWIRRLFYHFFQSTDGKSSEGPQCSSNCSPGCSHRVEKHRLGLNKRHHSLAVCNSFDLFYHRYVLEKVDLVIVGAEGVVESGGIINKVHFSKQELNNWPVCLFQRSLEVN